MFTQEVADTICTEIALGRSLRSVVQDAGMPSMATVFRWLAADESFREQYARARETQADTIFDEILDIADESKNDTWTDDDGNVRTNAEVVARSRIRIDARKWMAGKLRPKVYGEKVTTEVTGSLTHEHSVGLSSETVGLLESLKAGPSGPGNAAPVQD